ncbi:uncharacterized protein LOC124406600 isoform X2 [Diprion similis]|uniref:uncharacterized protein LOC124406600 isoform X2 n=1 Tax=Diprion similis TaxID=362088 RepID=UPI001EF85A33|nr:uncharacterized protein LOC124406600 isoform X2 [Diprion similis]
MSFLINQCIFRNMKRSVHEISRLRCILTEIKTGFVENKKFLPSLQQSCRFTSDSNAFDNKQISETEKIYQGSMTKQVRTIKVFTLITSITGIISQPMLYAKFEEIGLSPAMVGFGAFYGFFTLISPLLIHLVTKRYVTQIEYNSKEDYYTAYTYTFFVQRKKDSVYTRRCSGPRHSKNADNLCGEEQFIVRRSKNVRGYRPLQADNGI